MFLDTRFSLNFCSRVYFQALYVHIYTRNQTSNHTNFYFDSTAMDLKSVCSSAIWNESLFGWRGWYINLHLIQGFLTLKVTISVSWLFLFIWLTLSLCHLQENIVLEYSMITTPPIGQMKSSLKLSKIINSHRWHNFPEHLQVDELRRKFNTVRRSYSKRE